MPMTVTALLIFAAFLCTIISAAGRCPLWVPVRLVVLVQLLQIWPR